MSKEAWKNNKVLREAVLTLQETRLLLTLMVLEAPLRQNKAVWSAIERACKLIDGSLEAVKDVADE